MTEQPSRPLSLHERYCLARRNAGYPPILIIGASYPSANVTPTLDFLRQRIIELQEHFPLLYARINGSQTSKPLEVLREKAWLPDDVLSSGDYAPYDSPEHELERMLFQDGRRMTSQDFEARPLWQVTVYTHPTKERRYICLAADHIIVDGRGLALLFEALLAKDISTLPIDKLEDTPRLEETLNMKPTLGYLIPVSWKFFIFPALPRLIRKHFSKVQSSWPIALACNSPLECPQENSMLFIPAEKVSALKAVAKANGVPTLHPIIKSIYALTIWARFGQSTSSFPFHLSAGSPRSERDPKLGHPYCMSNYVSAYKFDITISPDANFWRIANQVSEYMTGLDGIAHARMGVGVLRIVPDGEFDPPHPDPRCVTKWEDFFLRAAGSDRPYTEGLSMSNIGLLKLPEGAEDMAWTQAAAAIGRAAVCTSALGHEKGLRLGEVWSDGAAVTREDVESMERIFVLIMARLIEGKMTAAELISEH